jgi:hypothetical protein
MFPEACILAHAVFHPADTVGVVIRRIPKIILNNQLIAKNVAPHNYRVDTENCFPQCHGSHMCIPTCSAATKMHIPTCIAANNNSSV